MTSALTWLDFSEDDQRRAREIVQMFTQRESRDELGIGVVRDAFSNQMFPGVSIIQTRARYFLFVPWIYQRAGERGRSGRALLAWANKRERALVEVLRAGGDEEGLIGRQAGTAVKRLPSAIYWNGLQRYGILKQAMSIEEAAARPHSWTSPEEGIVEQIGQSDTPWVASLPSPPEGFPDLDALDFVLTADEESWLRERLLHSTDGSLLAWMCRRRVTPSHDTNGPWGESWAVDLPRDLALLVHHADVFSHVMHGAAILYNVLLADKTSSLGFRNASIGDTDYRAEYDQWRQEIRSRRTGIEGWNREEFWSIVTAASPARISLARRFIDAWTEIVLDELELTEAAERLVVKREHQQKGGQARLANPRLLQQWGGASGIDRLTFRWGQVRRMMADLNGVVD